MRITRSAGRLCAAAVMTGLGLAACQNGDGQTGSVQTVVVTQEPGPSTSDGESPSTGDSGERAGLPKSWPDKEFPLPPAVTVIEANDSSGTGIVLTGVDTGEVVDFYRDALPAAGYKITKDKSVGVGGVGITGMEFTGHGYHGELAVLGSGTGGVTISLDEQ